MYKLQVLRSALEAWSLYSDNWHFVSFFFLLFFFFVGNLVFLLWLICYKASIAYFNKKSLTELISDIIVCKQVEVARPMDRNKKRVRENSESNSSGQDHSKLLKSNIHNSHVPRVNSSLIPLFLFTRFYPFWVLHPKYRNYSWLIMKCDNCHHFNWLLKWVANWW